MAQDEENFKFEECESERNHQNLSLFKQNKFDSKFLPVNNGIHRADTSSISSLVEDDSSSSNIMQNYIFI